MFGGGSISLSQGNMNSPEKPNNKRADDRTNCLPVSIRMLDMAYETGKLADGELRFHGNETPPGLVMLLAQVEAVHALQGTMAEFTVCDGTSRIRAKIYGAEGEQEQVVKGLTAGMWVRLLGHFRSAPSPHFSVSIIRTMESADEISHHTIEVVHAALKNLQHNGMRLEPPQTPQPKVTRAGADEPMDQGVMQTPEKPKLQEPGPKAMEVDDELTQKLPGQARSPALEGANLRAAILRLLEDLKASGDEVGMTLPEILQAIEKKGEQVADGLKAVTITMDTLQDDGETFTTIDDDHWGIP